MLQFIKYSIATAVGIFLFFAICLVLLVGMALLVGDGKPVVSNNSILHLNLNAQLTEQEIENPFEDLNIPLGGTSGTGLIETLRAIKQAASDDRIAGIYLSAGSIRTGFASLQELRDALLQFKESGKFIYAYSEFMNEAPFYIISVADSVFLHPQGGLEFNGLNAEVTFFKQALDKAGITPLVFRAGDFKGAVEPFLLDRLSNENRLQISRYLESLYTQYLNGVAQSRSLDAGTLRQLADKMLIQSPADALRAGLINDTLYADQVEKILKMAVGIEEKEQLTLLSLKNYLKSLPASDGSFQQDRVAVLVAEGDIVSGKSRPGFIGSQTINEELRKLRKDKKVKAIVLRINSPGGSAIASDAMWREIMLTRAEKPVIASMGDAAASGGYYMAMACDTIVAQPNTITGSIGVFALFFEASELLNKKLGITTEQVKTGEFSDIGNIARPLSEAERQILQRSTNEAYATFTRKAAQGRNMSLDSLLAVAGGRIWTGEDAHKLRLTDINGSLNDAIAIAAAKAGLSETDFAVRYHPTKMSFWESLRNADDVFGRYYLQRELKELYPLHQSWQQLQQLKGVQARLPFGISLR